MQPQQCKTKRATTTINKILLVLSCVRVASIVVIAIVFTLLASNWSVDLYQSMVEAGVTFNPDTPDTGLYAFTAMAIFSWICAIPAAWIVPMTIRYFKRSKDGKFVSVTFKVCTLLLVNLLAGILMLCCEPHADDAR